MSKRVVETSVVGLEFDTKNFQRGIQTSMRDLAALKKAMQLEGAARGFAEVDRAANNVRLGSLQDGIDSISNRFSLWGVAAATAVAKVTSGVMDLAHTMANTALIEPITQGYQEYEMQIGAIQTILANTKAHGTTLEDVMTALNKLNDFSDKTIYNFAQMVTSIGAFTTAGVALETSVEAIQGISGLAAISGSSAEKTANAMYMMSQAIADGTLRLRQWNSLQTAGMAGEIFRNELMRTARVHGIAVDKMVEDAGSFRMSLQEGWVTNQILLETLAKFTDEMDQETLRAIGYAEEDIAEILELGEMAMAAATNIKTFTQFQTVIRESIATGWTSTAVAIVGDFEEAVELYTKINNVLSGVIASSAEARNKQLEFWKAAGGREMVIDALVTSLQNATTIIGYFRSAWSDIFPPAFRAGNLLVISKMIQNLAHSLKMGVNSGNRFKRMVRGLASGIDIVKLLVLALLKPIRDLFRNLDFGGQKLLRYTLLISDYITNLRNVIIETDFFNVMVGRAVAHIQKFAKYIGGLVKEFMSLQIIQDIVAWFEKLTREDLIRFLRAIGRGFLAVAYGVTLVYDWVRKLEILQPFFEWLSTLTWDNFKGWADRAYAGIPEFIQGIKDLGVEIKDYFGITGDTIPNLIKWFSNLGESIGNLVARGRELKERFLSGEGVERLTAYLETFDGSRIRGFAEALKAEIKGAADFLGQFFRRELEESEPFDFDGMIAKIDAFLVRIADYISESGLEVSWPRFFDIIKTAFAVYASKEVVNMARTITRMFQGGWLQGIFGGLLGDPTDVRNSLTSVFGALENTLVTFQNNIKADTLLKIAGAIGVLTASLLVLAMLDNEQVAVGVGAMAAMAAQLVTVVAVIAKIPTVTLLKSTTALITLSGALMVMALSIKVLSGIDPQKLAVGMAAVSGALLLLVGVSRTMGSAGASVERAAGAMLILSISLLGFSQSVEIFGKMDPEVMAEGLLRIGAALAIFSAFSRLVDGARLISASVGVGILAGALLIMVEAVRQFSDISWEELERGLAGIAGVLALVVVAVRGMSGALTGAAALVVVSGALLVLAAAVKVLSGISWEGLAVALAAIAGVLVIFGLAGLVLGPVVPILLGIGAAMLLIGVAALTTGVGIAATAAGLIALGLAAPVVAAGITIIGGAIMLIIPRMAAAIVEGIVIFLETLAEAGPRLFTAGVNLIMNFVKAVDLAFPQILGGIVNLLTTILDTIAQYIPELLKSGFKLLMSLLSGISDNIGEVISTALSVVTEFLGGIADKVSDIVESGVSVVINFIEGITETLPELVDAAFEFILEWINALADAIEKYTPELLTALGNLADAIVDGLAKAVLGGIPKILESAKNLGQAVLDGITAAINPGSPSRETAKLGDLAVDGLLLPIVRRAKEVKSKFANLIDTAKEGMNEALQDMRLHDLNEDFFSPTIQPVLDLSLVDAGIIDLNRSLSQPGVMSLSAYDEEETHSTPRQATKDGKAEYVFIQNNTSPKALSTGEIYRRTNSLIGRVRQRDLLNEKE
jgi:tape measure domain-containing protein